MDSRSAGVDIGELRVKRLPLAGHVICLIDPKKRGRIQMMEDMHDHIEEPVMEEMEPSNLSTAQTSVRLSQHQETRLKRVLDYQVDVLKKESHLEAALGTVTAGLMTVAIQMDEFIEQALAVSPKTIDRVQKLLPSIQTYLQATRQIDRLAQVELRVAASRKGKSVGNAQPFDVKQRFMSTLDTVAVKAVSAHRVAQQFSA